MMGLLVMGVPLVGLPCCEVSWRHGIPMHSIGRGTSVQLARWLFSHAYCDARLVLCEPLRMS